MTLMQILGGVALVLFGVRFLRKGLDRLFGQSLVGWLQRMTTSRIKAFAAGVVTGTCAPSSTALSLVAVHLMTAGNVSAERMLSVLLGSGVGLTIMVQMLSLHIENAATWFLLFGVLGFQFMQREIVRGIGQCLLSLGLIFLAMQIIGTAAASLAADADARTILHILEEHPGAVLGLATVLTVLLQSSTAAIGLGIGLAQAKLLSVAAMIPWVLGANLGVAFTLFLVGYRAYESRRLAIAHLFAKGIGVLLLFLLLEPVTRGIQALPLAVGRQTADFHTAFNLLVGLMALPLVPALSWLARVMVAEPAPPSPGLQPALPESFLNEEALETPSLALAHATREALRMADECQEMLAGFWDAQQRRDPAAARLVQARDNRVDQIYHGLKEYLSRISQDNLNGRLGQSQMTLLAFTDELEAVADIIDRHLCTEIIKQVQEGIQFPAEDMAILAEVYARVRTRLSLAQHLLTVTDAGIAREFIVGKSQLSELGRRAQNAHYQRLQRGDRETLASSSAFLELLGGFQRINSHLGTLGYAFGAHPRMRRAARNLPASDSASKADKETPDSLGEVTDLK